MSRWCKIKARQDKALIFHTPEKFKALDIKYTQEIT